MLGLRGIDPLTNKLIPIEGLDTYNGPLRESPAHPRILKGVLALINYLQKTRTMV